MSDDEPIDIEKITIAELKAGWNRLPVKWVVLFAGSGGLHGEATI